MWELSGADGPGSDLDCGDAFTGVHICQNVTNYVIFLGFAFEFRVQHTRPFYLGRFFPITEAKLFQIFYPILREI